MLRYTAGEGYGIIRIPMAVMSPSHSQKDVRDVPAPSAHWPQSRADRACGPAGFPKGHPYLTLRDHLGRFSRTRTLPRCFRRGATRAPPWRLALVTIMQFRENLSDRQAAEAVRARIDWKYLLGLDLADPGFDFSVLSEFRDRLLAGSAEALLLR